MAAYARALRAQNVPVPDIARKLVIPSGKSKGEHPSAATVYRILAEDDTAAPTAWASQTATLRLVSEIGLRGLSALAQRRSYML